MKYILIWCAQGKLSLQVDDQDFTLETHELITITSGQAHFFQEKHSVSGYVLEFTYDFFCKDDKDIELVFHNGLFCHFDQNEIIHIDRPKLIETPLKKIDEELTEKPYQYLISIHSLIELILVSINREKVNRGDEIWRPSALFLRFLELIRNDFNHQYTIDYYARSLHTSEQKLNDLAKLHVGKTAQMVVWGLIASEAKRLLTYENLTVKEIAYRLGFKDPFYFSNFFKKHTLKSPKAYQASIA